MLIENNCCVEIAQSQSESPLLLFDHGRTVADLRTSRVLFLPWRILGRITPYGKYAPKTLYCGNYLVQKGEGNAYNYNFRIMTVFPGG